MSRKSRRYTRLGIVFLAIIVAGIAVEIIPLQTLALISTPYDAGSQHAKTVLQGFKNT